MQGLIAVIKVLLIGWFSALVAFLRALCAFIRRLVDERRQDERDRKAAKTRCVPIQDPAFVRPDPLIYSQRAMAALGLKYSWDNPDFAIYRLGVLVGAHELERDTTYDVILRIWNASAECPVVAMPVRLSYLSFGIGTTSHEIGLAEVDVGVKGSFNNPSFIKIPWHTPLEEGHYCLQALLEPVADVNYVNNFGQQNTDVVHAHSPGVFSFALRNNTLEVQNYSFVVDTYIIGSPKPCVARGTAFPDYLVAHREQYPLPPGWKVELEPSSPTLAPDQQISVVATVTPPAGFKGKQVVNVHALYRLYYEEHLAGGVTMTVMSS